MANTSTLIRKLSTNSLGTANLYHVNIDTINTYVNIGDAVADPLKFQAILGMIVGTSAATILTFGLSASINFPIKGINGPHGIPISNAIYIAGTNGYRIQVKSDVACDILIAITEVGGLKV
jgi:hypothetical protein